MEQSTVDNRNQKEYNGGTAAKKRPYNPEVYRKYRANRPRKINYCQLKGCGRELPRFDILSHRRFCCTEHATEYQAQYRKEWRKNNRDKVLAQKKRYRLKLTAEKIISARKSNETRPSKTYAI